MSPDFLELIPLEMPGRGARFSEPLLRDLKPMVEDVFEQIKERISAPYILFGHSMGARMAYLLIHKLIEKGLPLPLHFIASGCPAPQVPNSGPASHLLPRKEFIARLKEYNGSPKEVLENEMMMDLFEPILRADFEAAHSFVYQKTTPFDIPLTALVGLNENIGENEIQAWSKETLGRFQLHSFPGKHFFIFDHLDRIVKIMGLAAHPSRKDSNP